MIILIACTILCACKSGAPSNNQSLNQPEEYIPFTKPSSKQLENGKLNICLITKSYGSNYWNILIKGVTDSAEEHDVNLFTAAVKNENDTDCLARLIDEALLMKPDAIILSPADTKEINDAVIRINEAGIPLIYVDTILNGPQFDACYMTDNMEAGRMVAQDMLKKLTAQGHTEDESISIGINIGSKKSQTIIERLAGFNEYWSNNAPKNWKITDKILCNEGSSDIAHDQCLEYMNNYKNLAGLIGLNNGSTVGLCRGLIESGRTDLVLIGFDYSDEIAALIADVNYSVSAIVQSQYNMGYESVKKAIEINNNKTSLFKYYDTGVIRIDHNNYTSPYIKSIVSIEE